MAPQGRERVTRADIEAKLRQIKGEVDTAAGAARPFGLVAGLVALVGLVGAAYVLGRRKGRKRTTVVEVKRV